MRRNKKINWKNNQIFPCSECWQLVPIEEVMRTKERKIICESCYIPSR